MYQGCMGKKYHQGEFSLCVFRQRWEVYPGTSMLKGWSQIPQSMVSSENPKYFLMFPLHYAGTVIMSYTLPLAQTIRIFLAKSSPCRFINGDTHLKKDKGEKKVLGNVVSNFINFADWWKWRGRQYHAVFIQISVCFVHLWRCPVWRKNLLWGLSEILIFSHYSCKR